MGQRDLGVREATEASLRGDGVEQRVDHTAAHDVKANRPGVLAAKA